MQILNSHFGAVKVLRPTRHADHRGFFSESYSRRDYAAVGIDHDFVQDNHSLSRKKGVVRGLHFQLPPFAQAKLLRVLRGSVLDVAVDIRTGSPSFGRHIAVILSAEDGNQIFIPAGFAHGFCTLEPDTEIFYKVDNYYSPEHDRGLLWDDPALGIAWPVAEDEAELSERDRKHPLLAELPSVFFYEDEERGRRAVAA
jgi:dTDP-4-dehydrorhamnose 3,5-epimerase